MDPKESKHLNPRAIFSKTGKGVHEASGKTSHLSRADRAVLAAIDGKTPLADISAKFEKISADKFDALIQLLDKDGFVREVSSGQSAAPSARPAAPAAKAPPKAPPPADEGDDMDFTQAIKIPAGLASGTPKGPAPAAPKPPQVDLAATARAGAERKAEEDLTLNFRAREELQAKMKAELEAKAKADARARAEAEARAQAAAEAKAAAESKAHAESEARTRAEAEAKVKAAREAAVRMATEVKAKAEAEGRSKAEAAEREKARVEAELNAKLDAERKAREDAERRAAEAAGLARRELEEKARRDAEEMRQRLEAEMKAKLDAERKVREEEDRKRREEEDRKRKEEDERRAKEDAERRAREETERKKREEEERKRKEADERRRKEDDERRAKEEAERKARAEADRKTRDEEDRKRKEEAEKRSREDAERKKRDEEDRKQREEDDRRRKEEDARRAKEEAERRARDTAEANARAAASASLPAIEPVVAPPPPPPPPPPAAAAPPASDLGDLLGDLDNFGKQEEEERKAKEEAERQAKEAAARKAKDDAERRAKEAAERKAKEEEEGRRKAEEEQRAQEEAERKAREEEERRKHEEAERKQEEAERKRKLREALAAKQSAEQSAKAAAGAASGGDVDVKEDDADMDDIKRDQKALAKRAAAREQPLSAVLASSGRPRRWGKPAAMAGLALLVVGIGALHVVPVSTSDYEKGASEALGAPVKIGSARMSLITGVELKFENVAIGDSAKIRLVRGTPDIGSLFGGRKAFSRIELEGVSMAQAQIADALLGKAAGANFRIGRVTAKQLSLDGPMKLPPLDMDATLAADGSVQSVSLTGSDKLLVQLSPKGSEIAFEISAGSLALPFVPALTLADFGMKGTANRSGVASASFDGRAYDGVISGTARIQWGAKWSMDGEVRARTVKVAVFAPALISQGKLEGEGKFAMSGADPVKLYEGARLEGNFKIENGVIGKFNLRRALETGGAQTGGRTEFAEMTGQGVYERGAVQLRNLAFSSGAMNANVSIDVDANGGIAGRISADVKTPNQTLRAILNISGKVQDPVIRK